MSALRALAVAVLAAGCLVAQPVVSADPEPIGQAPGHTLGNYNVANSFETGYRFLDAGGNIGKYRSDVNYGNGIRLLSGQLSVHSMDGRGRLFDEIMLNTLGLGNDPYQASTLRIAKNKVYRYDLSYRLNDFFNPALTISDGLHLMNTQRRLQDHELTLLPQSAVRFFLGATHNVQDGPALTTTNFLAHLGDEFPLFADVRRLRREFRLGGEVRLSMLRFHAMRGWDSFEESTLRVLTAPSQGANPAAVELSSLFRNEPYSGKSPFWRLNLLAEPADWVSLNGRFTHVDGQRDFLFEDFAFGVGAFGNALNRQTLVRGSGRRPVASGSFTASLFPGSRVILTNQTAFHNTRMEGDNVFEEVINNIGSPAILNFQLLGIRLIENATTAQVAASKWTTVHGGYSYSNRRIRSREAFEVGGDAFLTPGEQENVLHSGLFGLRLKPLGPLTVNLDAEIGRADRPFFPVSERKYHALGARAQYKYRSLLLSAATRTHYNNNSVTVSAFSSRSRNYAFDASWTPRAWFAFDAGYTKNHLDTLSGLAFFEQRELQRGQLSLYVSNIHTTSLGVHLGMLPRTTLFLGYTRVQDTGDGRGTLTGPGIGSPNPFFQAVQTFPLTFQSPLARLSVKIAERLSWNFGYQYYGYSERLLALQNYRAHTGYTSLTWAF
jgi:hypothetical protein